MEEIKVKDYLYDYQKNSFKIKNELGKKKYYIKIKSKYLEVDEKIYKLCKASYDKLRYTYEQEVANSVLHFEDIDLATSFYLKKDIGALNKLWLKSITDTIYAAIDQFNNTDKQIATLFFIYEYSISDISKKLNIPRKTVEYRKDKIQKHLQKIVIDFCHFDE